MAMKQNGLALLVGGLTAVTLMGYLLVKKSEVRIKKSSKERYLHKEEEKEKHQEPCQNLATDWGYGENNMGPKHWGEHPDFSMAFEGKNQSPINFLTAEMPRNPSNTVQSLDLKIHNYQAKVKCNIQNNGRTIILRVDSSNQGGQHVEIKGETFALVQWHFHAESEHTVDGRRYPLELHLVHQSEAGNIAVIGVLFEYGKESPFLSQFFPSLPALSSAAAPPQPLSSLIDLSSLQLNGTFYRYMGSLTTPPCAENVIWTVMAKVDTCSPEQRAQFQVAIPFNNFRPLQKTHGRVPVCCGCD